MKHPFHLDLQVAGIDATKTDMLIRLNDPASVELARNNTEWLNGLGNDTKLVVSRL